MSSLPVPRASRPVRQGLAIAAAVVMLVAGASVAHAQSLESLKGALKGGDSTTGAGSGGAGATGGGALGGLLGGGMPSLGSVGTGNLTGVLTYCARNNLVGGAGGVKDKLLGKLGGEKKAEADPGYREGLSGVLGGKSDRKMNLTSAGGLKSQVTEKVCDEVLKYGKSLI